MLADVRVGARSLGEAAQAVAAGEAGLDQWRSSPVGLEMHRGRLGQHRPEARLGLGEGALVALPHRLVEEPSIAKAHLGRDMTQKRHQRLQRAAGI